MASFRSLGVHAPAALPYLVAEGILPEDPSDDLYTWDTYLDPQLDASEDEIVTTDFCVIWSRGGVVQKVFRFEIEQQKVVQAVLTRFPLDSVPRARDRTAEHQSNVNANHENKHSAATAEDKKDEDAASRAAEPKKSPVAGSQSSRDEADRQQDDASRALVVFLKSQAHVYFLNGSSHVVNLPFEVDKAFPAPRGLILQRKVPAAEKIPLSPTIPAPPKNSFYSSQVFSQSSSHPKLSFTSAKSGREGASGGVHSLLLEDLVRSSRQPSSDALPRLFSFTDPLSEMGLVVTHASARRPGSSFSGVTSMNASAKFEAIDKAEHVLYVSTESELPTDSSDSDKPLLLVVSVNYATRMYSVWHASYIDPKPASSVSRRRSSAMSGNKPRRRSSYATGTMTGATTPGIRPRDGLRESIGVTKRSKTVPASFSNTVTQSRDPVKQTAEDALASQLDPDYGLPRQPTRESRRVSSLLSRAELSTSFDRSAFQGLATNQGSQGASFGGQGRRVQSFGGTYDRASFAGAQQRNRASTPASVARLSFGALSVDDSATEVTVDGDDESELFDPMDIEPDDGFLHEPFNGLRKEFVMTKFVDISIDDPDRAPIFKSHASASEEQGPVKIFTTTSPPLSQTHYYDRQLFLHIVDRQRGVHVRLQCSVVRERMPSSSRSSGADVKIAELKHALIPSPVDVKRTKDQVDSLKVRDNGVSRVLTLTRDQSGAYSFALYSSWRPNTSFEFPICKLKLFNPYAINDGLSPDRSNAGRRRTLQPPSTLRALSHPGAAGTFHIVDHERRHHKLQLHLRPRHEAVASMMDVCQFVLPHKYGEFLLVTWWKILRWLQADCGSLAEWKAFVVSLFCLAIPSILRKTKSGPPSIARSRLSMAGEKRRSSLSPASSRRSGDAPWQKMWKIEAAGHATKSWNTSPWNWSSKYLVSVDAQQSQHDFIVSCIAAARDFLRSEPQRETLDFLQGSSSSKDRHKWGEQQLPRILVALHLFYEEQKLNVLSQGLSTSINVDLGPVLAQIGHWLRWDLWSWKQGGYYDLDGAGVTHWDFEDSYMNSAHSKPASDDPPSVLEWVERSHTMSNHVSFPTLGGILNEVHNTGSTPYQPLKADSLTSQSVARLTPRTIALMTYFTGTLASDGSDSANVEAMASSGLSVQMLETFPEGIQAPLREAIVRCQASPPTTWPSSLLSLVGREDLNLALTQEKQSHDVQSLLPSVSMHATRDVHTICHAAEQPEPAHSSPEADRFAITRLLFSEDRRFVEAAKLLEPLKIAVAECTPEPSWSESEYLEAQKGVMQWVMVRTFALPSGQAMLMYDSKRPLLTEKFPLHGFTTVCIMKPMNNTVSADRSNYTEEKYSWAFFHAGVSAGLSISRQAEGIDTSWIMFNKPAELHNRHAGLLFALGLNGHLKTIAKWLSFKYLTPKHTMTSIGLLLGLSASYLGTMDTLVTRLLSVHVTRMLPPGAAELNLSPMTQTTGLMGIGLLYCDTQHRRMSEVMLSEIEHVDVEDPSGSQDILRDEGYRLAAGFALGFINLGKGKDLRGLHDMRLIERLLAVAVGPRPVDVVHILDRATAGATIAIALTFMKTGDRAVARKVDIPDTLPQFDYVRPDMFLLRTLAKHLILWESIQAESKWIISNLPADYRPMYQLKDIKALRSEHMPFYNIVAGLLWSISLKYAGTGDTKVRNFLVKYLDQFIRIAHLPAPRYDARLTRNTVRNCQDLVALSAATVMAGIGDLVVFRRLRSLHGRVGPDIPYGSHLAAHLALGVLFLGAGSYTLGTSNLAVASLVCAFYPLFPATVLDNRAHLQAFRHFWVLAAAPRCLVARDVDTRRAIALPVSYTLRDTAGGATVDATAPCLLPDLADLASIRTASPDYWQVTLDFVRNPHHLPAFARSHTLLVRRRPPSDAHHAGGGAGVFSAALAALDAAHTAAHLAHAAGPITGPAGGASGSAALAPGAAAWDWLYSLRALAGVEREDRGHVIPTDANSAGHLATEPSVVDVRLGLVRAARSWRRADLLALRGFLGWVEAALARGERLRYVSVDVVAALRAVLLEREREVGG